MLCKLDFQPELVQPFYIILYIFYRAVSLFPGPGTSVAKFTVALIRHSMYCQALKDLIRSCRIALRNIFAA